MRKNPELSNYYRTYTRDSVNSLLIFSCEGENFINLLSRYPKIIQQIYPLTFTTILFSWVEKKKINTMFISTIYQYMNKKETPANSRRIDPLTIDITILIYQGECTNQTIFCYKHNLPVESLRSPRSNDSHKELK